MINTKHGVLYKTGLLIRKADHWDVKPLPTALMMSSLCKLAVEYRLTHLWVMKDTGISPDRTFTAQAHEQWSLQATYLYPKESKLPEGKRNEAVSVIGRRRAEWSEQRHIAIIFPRNTKWGFGHTNNPKHLLLTIDQLEKALGVEVGGNLSLIGWSLIETMGEHHPEWMVPKEIDLTRYHFDLEAAKDIIWQRPLHAYELRKHYLHKYIKNALYLRECLSQHFGVGEPAHVPGSAYNQHYPGVWRISVEEKILHNLPSVLWQGAEWVAAPLVKLLFEIGEHVTVHEGWVYPLVNGEPQYHQWLKPWAKLMSEKWRQLKEEVPGCHTICRKYAQESISSIVLATISMTSSRSYEEGEEMIMEHPEVKVQIVGGARASMLHHMLEVQQDSLMTPFLVYRDSLYYLSDEPEPDQAASGRSKRKVSSNGFKREWTLPLTRRVRGVLTTKCEPNEKQHALNRIGKKLQDA